MQSLLLIVESNTPKTFHQKGQTFSVVQKIFSIYCNSLVSHLVFADVRYRKFPTQFVYCSNLYKT